MSANSNAELVRLEEAAGGKAPWRRWGPYLSERQWGTVREDYSADGDAWSYLPHDHARSRAYRWGEDGLAGISDDQQKLCFAISLWNGQDAILKERLFGLTNEEGNHGEDVKEYYFYLDNVPTHAYMKYLYKYPQKAFPYEDLVETNRKRTRLDFEYELLDTKIFDEDRYFDVFVEYAKASPLDMQIQISVANRGPERATLELLPTLWFRNLWSFDPEYARPNLQHVAPGVVKATNAVIGTYWLYAENVDQLLFTENETNKERLFGVKNDSRYVKDGINDYIVQNKKECVNPENQGTKAAFHYSLNVDSGQTVVLKLRLSNVDLQNPFSKGFDDTFTLRKNEADQFYRHITPTVLPDDMRNVQRQAFSNLLWNKQFYSYDISKWLNGDPKQPPPPPERKNGRNHEWFFFDSVDIFSMPDKWEYPWFAMWDLAFHTVTLAMIDPEFAKRQLLRLTKEWYMHPNGQFPAYEWSFNDANPPVIAWAAMRVYQIEHRIYGKKDRGFLESMFQKLVINFTWWVNRKDKGGRNVFEGGFLGMDNIGPFDRRFGPPEGGTFEQPDGTGWMGMYCLNLLQIALELAIEDPIYEEMATKFFEHFIYIGDAINNVTGCGLGLWDNDKGYYYGLITSPDGRHIRLADDTLTGLVPLFAVATNESSVAEMFPNYRYHFQWFVDNRPDLLNGVADIQKLGVKNRILLAFANDEKLKRVLEKVLDENQFLSPFGVRSVSKRHAKEPYTLYLDANIFRLDYEPAESTTGLFGGNSNWRGPIWFPINYLLIETLQKFHYYYGDDFKVECPKGSKNFATLWEVSANLSQQLIKIFLKDENGRRPVYGGIEKFQTDPHWKDYILFHEYFHGDNGAGLGASSQGWTALVAKLIQQYGEYALCDKSPAWIEEEKIGHV